MTEKSHAAAEVELHILVMRCQVGDERAFTTLFNRFAPKTERHLRAIVGDDADDVQQEVWLAVFRSIARLEDPRAFRTWLFSLTRRRAIDHLRQQRRMHELQDDAQTELAADTVATDMEDHEPDAMTLDALLDGLSKVQCEIVLLRYKEELSYAQIAMIVGCSVGTVKSRIHSATQRLAQLAAAQTRASANDEPSSTVR